MTEGPTEATTEPAGQSAGELSPEQVQTLVAATAQAEFEDSMRPPKRPAGNDSDDESVATADQESDDDANANHEAAKWRTKLRESESQNTAIATRLENMQRAAIDTHVTALGMKPAALWASGAKLEDLLDDTGVPDAAKVAQAAQAAKETLGIVAVKPSKPVGSLRSGASAPTPKGNKWVEAFGPHGSE